MDMESLQMMKATERVLQRLASGDAMVHERNWFLPDCAGARRLVWLSDGKEVGCHRACARLAKDGLATVALTLYDDHMFPAREVVAITPKGRDAARKAKKGT